MKKPVFFYCKAGFAESKDCEKMKNMLNTQRKLSYGAGSFWEAGLYNFMTTFLLLYMTGVVMLPPDLAGAAVLWTYPMTRGQFDALKEGIGRRKAGVCYQELMPQLKKLF